MLNKIRSWFRPLSPTPEFLEVIQQIRRYTVSVDVAFTNMADIILEFSTEEYREVSPGIFVKLIELPSGYSAASVHAVAGSKFPKHAHTHPEGLYTLFGKAIDPVSGFILEKHNYFYAKPNEPHGLEILEDWGGIVDWDFDLHQDTISN